MEQVDYGSMLENLFGEEALRRASRSRDLLDPQRVRNLVAVPHGYRWFNPSNEREASCALRAVQVALARSDPKQVALFASAVAKVYHLDRAERGASVLAQRPVPTAGLTLPVYLEDMKYQRRERELSRWGDEIPLVFLRTLAAVEQVAPPDHLMFVEYRKVEYRHSPPSWPSRYPDPWIFAVYGQRSVLSGWWVLLAQWT